MASNIKYHLSLVAANVLYGINYSYYRSVLEDTMSVGSLFYLRVLSVALLVAPYMFIKGIWRIELRDLPDILVFVVLISFGRQLLLLKGMEHASPIDGSIITTLAPILIITIAAITIRERVKGRALVGLIAGFGGAILLILTTKSRGAGSSLIGNLLILISILSLSLNTIHIKRALSKYNVFTVIGWAAIISTIITTPLFAKELWSTSFSTLSIGQWSEVGYLITAGTALASLLLYYGLKHVSATAESIYIYLQPITAAVFSVARGQNTIAPEVVVASLLIMVGVYFVQQGAPEKGKISL